MIQKSNIEMLSLLKANNNREWFAEHKKAFQKEENQVKVFFKEIFVELSKIDNLDKMQIFRIYRDVRFSKDKSPYKSHYSVAVSYTHLDVYKRQLQRFSILLHK